MITRNVEKGTREFEVHGVQQRILLAREESEGVEVSLLEYPPGARFPLNSHREMEELYLILEGGGEITVGDETRGVTNGDLILVPRHTMHRIANTGDYVLRYLCVSTFPEGYPPDEKTWASHEEVVAREFGAATWPAGGGPDGRHSAE